MADELAGSSFLGTSNYFMPESRSISFAVEEDPWSAAGFDPVDEMRQPLHQPQAMDEDMVAEGITAANALGNYNLKKKLATFFFFSHLKLFSSRS